METQKPLLLATGATGYVGGRLRRRLEEDGHRVRCLARDPVRLAGRVASSTEVFRGDLLDPPSLRAALQGVTTAYTLVHSMGSGEAFEEADRQAAKNFAAEAEACGVRKIIGIRKAEFGLPLPRIHDQQLKKVRTYVR